MNSDPGSNYKIMFNEIFEIQTPSYMDEGDCPINKVSINSEIGCNSPIPSLVNDRYVLDPDLQYLLVDLTSEYPEESLFMCA